MSSLEKSLPLLRCPQTHAPLVFEGDALISTDPATARLGAVDWVFNGWGAQGWARWEKDLEELQIEMFAPLFSLPMYRVTN